MNRLHLLGIVSLSLLSAAPVVAQQAFTLASPALTDGGPLPQDLKCTRDGGDGLSPPLDWTNPPEGTVSYAIIMHHYPRGTVEGVDAPSQYWLLWNIPATVTSLDRGNPTSIGDEGADKDERGTGYTSPCSPAGPPPPHQYTITAYALSDMIATLPDHDDPNVEWAQMTAAMEGLVLASSSLTFTN